MDKAKFFAAIRRDLFDGVLARKIAGHPVPVALLAVSAAPDLVETNLGIRVAITA